ncbi:hypothetical protein INT80_14160 [Gallibacterium anatis]|uniref:Uncharacterized protein n=1 Tax=Gallibacterium anatis TaxID=750 RepID=A0A930UXR8_9PAST|nr:hypothetical protein [Gallibacterium anatis]
MVDNIIKLRMLCNPAAIGLYAASSVGGGLPVSDRTRSGGKAVIRFCQLKEHFPVH